MTIAGTAQDTAISIAMDMTAGIIAHHGHRANAVLRGHVLASMIQAMISLVIVIAVAVGIGLRPSARPIELLAVAGLFVLVTFAFTWLLSPSGW